MSNTPLAGLAGLLLQALLTACGGPVDDAPGRAPALVIAHRGASGERAQHSRAAYRLAHAQGADAIEPDVVATRDGELVCSHDLWVGQDVAGVGAFADRVAEDGKLYIAELTLAELRGLRRHDSRHDEPGGFGYLTLDEFLELIASLDAAAGRRTLVIPEAKAPGFHRGKGLALERRLIEALARHGYRERDDAAIIQCVEIDALRRMHALGCELRLLLLVDTPVDSTQLDEWAAVADGLGPSRRLIEPAAGSESAFDLVAAAQARGLAVYVYTFADEPEAMARFFGEHGVDGVFTDFPAVGLDARRRAAP